MTIKYSFVNQRNSGRNQLDWHASSIYAVLIKTWNFSGETSDYINKWRMNIILYENDFVVIIVC